MKVAYCACFFFGERRFERVSGIKQEKYFYLRKQLDFISSNPKYIDTFYIIVNSTAEANQEEIIDIVNSYEININVITIFRENINLSYGAWNDAIKIDVQNNGGHDYYFLIEDDYIPISPSFIDAFLSKIKDKTAFVAVRVSPPLPDDIQNLKSHIEINDEDLPVIHASNSNGLLNGLAVKEMLEKYENVFLIFSSSTYEFAETNQLMFLQMFVKNGYSITDISDRHLEIFNHNDGSLQRTGSGSAIIVPIRGDLNDITF